MATVVKCKKGNKIVLLNPAEKGKRFARQLKNKCVSETGEVLDEKGKAFRAGYLTARSDNAKAYCSKMGIKSKSKPRKKKSFKN